MQSSKLLQQGHAEIVFRGVVGLVSDPIDYGACRIARSISLCFTYWRVKQVEVMAHSPPSTQAIVKFENPMVAVRRVEIAQYRPCKIHQTKIQHPRCRHRDDTSCKGILNTEASPSFDEHLCRLD